MKECIGWKFPPRDGGLYAGPSDPGIEIFAGRPYMSLAREVIQNSLDARRSHKDGERIRVTFERIDILPEHIPGKGELLESFKSCRKEARRTKSDKGIKFFDDGIKMLASRKKISCLKVSDYNTTGLRGGEDDPEGQWCAITKGSGSSVHKDITAGGSYGIGKSAPFAASDLHTVFYYTNYFDKKSGRLCERAQGKAILMSHDNAQGKQAQGTGFYGVLERCLPINNEGGGRYRSSLDGR